MMMTEKPIFSNLIKYNKDGYWQYGKGWYECPKCGWDDELDFPLDKYIVIENKGIKILVNYWIPENDDPLSPCIENKDVTAQVDKKIYPVMSDFTRCYFGERDWIELHCCPVHGEFSYHNGD